MEAIVISCPADERWPAVQGARYPPQLSHNCGNLFHVHSSTHSFAHCCCYVVVVVAAAVRLVAGVLISESKLLCQDRDQAPTSCPQICWAINKRGWATTSHHNQLY